MREGNFVSVSCSVPVVNGGQHSTEHLAAARSPAASVSFTR
jgi:hypothetical protein